MNKASPAHDCKHLLLCDIVWGSEQRTPAAGSHTPPLSLCRETLREGPVSPCCRRGSGQPGIQLGDTCLTNWKRVVPEKKHFGVASWANHQTAFQVKDALWLVSPTLGCEPHSTDLPPPQEAVDFLGKNSALASVSKTRVSKS